MAVTDALRFLRPPTSLQMLADRWERWSESLRACLPSGARRALAQRDQHLVVAPQGATAALSLVRPGETHPLGVAEAQSPETLAAIVSGVRRTSRRTVVRLPADEVLTRDILLPVQVRNNLRRVVGYEIDRLSPFQADQVYFDFRLAERAPRGGDKLAVELALCRRDVVEGWLRRLREAGSPADQLTWEGAWSKANLLSPEDRPQRHRSLVTAPRVLSLIVLLLLVSVLATPLWQKQRSLDDLNANLAALRKEAVEVEEVRTALEQARQGSTAILQRKLDEPRSIDLLRELTVRLPDDTWVQNLDLRDGEVQVRGESAQSTALIELLEKAPGISGVSFRSPVVQVATTGQERFHISFRVSPPEAP